MNVRPPTLEELKEGLVCEIIDLKASADQIQNVSEVKKVFKKDIKPELIYKSHILTPRDVHYYTMYPELISRDLRIITDL